MGKIKHADVGGALSRAEWEDNSSHEINGVADLDIVRTVTYVVAASDAPAHVKAQADYVCDGTADDVEIQAAIDAAAAVNGSVLLLDGIYNLTSALTITTSELSLLGIGAGTRVVQKTADTNCLTITGAIDRVHIADMQMGTYAGTGNCIEATNLYRSIIENIDIPGCGNYGLVLNGCLINKLSKITVSGNISKFDASIAGHVGGIKLTVSGVACNANTIIDPCIEGGTYGVYQENQSAEGTNEIIGGTIEGMSTSAIHAVSSTGFKVIGTHLEGAGADIYLQGCLDSFISPSVCRDLELVSCTRVHVDGGAYNGISLDKNCNYCLVENLSYGHFAGSVINYSQTSDFKNLDNVANVDITFGRRFEGGVDILGNPEMDWDGSEPARFQRFGGGSANVKVGEGLGDTEHWNGLYAVKVPKGAASTYRGLMENIGGPHSYLTRAQEWVVIEARIKAIDCTPIIYIYIDGGASINSYVCGTDTTAWQKVIISTHVPVGRSGFRVLFQPAWGETGNIYVDAVQILVENPVRSLLRMTDLFMDVLGVSATHVRSNEDLSAGVPITFTIDAQPDVPRTLSGHFDSHAQITAYTIAIVGVDAKGITRTETKTEADGWDWETSYAFATITSITMSARTGTGAGDTMDIGITDVLGLSNILFATTDVYKIKKNNADATVAVAQVNLTYDTYDMSVIGLAATNDFTIWYRIPYHTVEKAR